MLTHLASQSAFIASQADSSSLQWFFIVVIIQNYFLSSPYGRNWLYLWSNQAVPAWQIVILILVFFIGVWIAFLYLFSYMSKSHSWVLPVFAMGLGAPRWAQILWSTSNMGTYLPWTAGPIASGLAGRSLWLWLGVLDAVQGVGETCPSSLTTHTSPLSHPHRHHRLADTYVYIFRLRNDTAPNPHPLPRPLHASRGTNAWLPDNDNRTGISAGQTRTRQCLSKLLHQSARGVEFSVVLGGVAVSAGGADRVWGFFSEGAVE